MNNDNAKKASRAKAESRGGVSRRGLRRRSGSECPPSGNTGGKVQWSERTVGCHWLRVVHPSASRDELRRELVRAFGEPDDVRGRWFYEHGERFSNGTLLLWGTIVNREQADDDDAPGETCCVDVPGSAIDDMEPAERFNTLRRFTLGGRVTRIDLAADAVHAERVGLIEAATASCDAGELCGSRVFEPRRRTNAGEVEAFGLCIGRRGKAGSGRYVRMYDKGLETGERPMGQWERLEVEFSGDCAAEVGVDLFGGSNDWEPRAWARINGAISFRKSTGRRELSMRPIVTWWAEWIAGPTPLSTIMRRTETTLQRHTRWLTDTVLPTVARLGQEVGVSFTDALYRLCGPEVKARRSDKYMRAMVAEWRELLGPRPLIAVT